MIQAFQPMLKERVAAATRKGIQTNRSAESMAAQRENVIVEQEPGFASARAPYTRPTLERLGHWRAFTLQQSVPVFG